jgi:flavin reductase (DIM6/NTAB) family NADH-FMN oxidoreductase RutF
MPSRLRRLLLGGDALAAWVCVGHAAPEEQVEVLLHAPGRAPVDITDRHATVALRPLTVAVGGLPEAEAPTASERLTLAVRERQSGALLGEVRLRPLAWPQAGDPPIFGIRLFTAAGCSNRCLPAPRLQLQYLAERLRLWRDHDPHNQQKMTPADLFAKWVLFCLPRPVVVVSYSTPAGSNLFPMDLVGPAGPDRFLLGLHQPSPATAPILAARRLAVSTVPLAFRPLVFGLGRNHRHAAVDLGAVPFALDRSATLSVPVPRAAITVREVELLGTAPLASHLLLITRTLHLERRSQGLQMCHTHGFYQHALARRGRALPVCEQSERRERPVARSPGEAGGRGERSEP